MTTQCCVCRKIRERGQWKDRVPAGDGMVSHTYCPICLRHSLEQIRQEQTQESGLRATA